MDKANAVSITQWECSCPGVRHDVAEPSCTACGFVRPASLDPLPEDWGKRLWQIANWLDVELSRRPTLLRTTNGGGLMALLGAIQREPATTYRALAANGRLLVAVMDWVEQGTAPDTATFTDALGPPEI